MDFKKLLYDVDNNLSQEDFESLKFLCVDLIPKNKREKMKSCLDLFDELQKSGDLSEDDYFILAELLYLIGQHSLLKKLSTNKNEIMEHLREERNVSMYRRMLFKLSENITRKDLNDIIFLLDIPNKSTENKNFLDILCYLEKNEAITEDNLQVLEQVIGNVSQELLKKIHEYKKYKESPVMPSAPIENAHLPLSDPPLSIQAVSSTYTEFQNDEMESIREHIGEVLELPSEKDVETENDMSNLSLQDQRNSEVYPMNRKHRGYCVIINNLEFIKSDSRPGTEKDAEYLQRVFKWLGFDVKIYDEQKAQQIRDIIRDFQMKDHNDRDCFVCCILTHGQSQKILGTDNEVVNINDIVSNFSSKCKTLAGKPKLFFIQACQGKNTQGSHLIEEDAVSSTKTIPNEADVLIGMSTVDGYFSYRHRVRGTWYIQALCSNLVKLVPKGEDILSILTKVNKDVSEQEYKKSGGDILKQMPQPNYTLRLKIVFPIPNSAFEEYL